jgi:rhamnosyltransferase
MENTERHMRISVVIRCYNEQEHIGRLLDGIAQQTLQDVEVIVVDSGSTDRTLEVVAGYDANVLTIASEDFSFGRSLNLGARAATGEIIVAASAHVYPLYTDWLERLVEPFREPEVALTYGKQRGDSRTRWYSEHRVFEKWFPNRSDATRKSPFCNNANAAVRRSVWASQPYDESLTGLEDIEWAKRALAEGYRVAYVPEAEVAHVHEESPRRIFNRYRREAIALKRIFPHEHFHSWDFLRLFVGNVLSDWRHAYQDGVFWKDGIGIMVFRLMQFWGTYRGFLRHRPVDSELKQTFYYPDSPGGSRARRILRKAERVEYDAAGTGQSVPIR